MPILTSNAATAFDSLIARWKSYLPLCQDVSADFENGPHKCSLEKVFNLFKETFACVDLANSVKDTPGLNAYAQIVFGQPDLDFVASTNGIIDMLTDLLGAEGVFPLAVWDNQEGGDGFMHMVGPRVNSEGFPDWPQLDRNNPNNEAIAFLADTLKNVVIPALTA